MEKIDMKNQSSMCVNVIDDDYYLIKEKTTLPRIKVKTSKYSNFTGRVLVNLADGIVQLSMDDGVSDSSDDHTYKRCHYFCDKKVGSLYKFRCRCGGWYCKVHQFPKDHACRYDYVAHGRDKFFKEISPICKADKLKTRV